jgi:hypothetical protein
MELTKLIEFVDKYNLKVYLVNLAVVVFTALSYLFGIFDGDMKVSHFFEGIARVAGKLFGGVATFTAIHLFIWWVSDFYKRNGETIEAVPAGAPTPVAETKVEKEKKEEK